MTRSLYIVNNNYAISIAMSTYYTFVQSFSVEQLTSCNKLIKSQKKVIFIIDLLQIVQKCTSL